MAGEQQRQGATGVAGPITIYLSCAPEDVRHMQALERHLLPLRSEGLITTWHVREIMPGSNYALTWATQLDAAAIILLFISSDFLASPQCSEHELPRALARAAANEAYVVPVLVKPVDWEHTALAALPILPRNHNPLIKWTRYDDACVDVVRGIRTLVEAIRATPARAPLPRVSFAEQREARIPRTPRKPDTQEVRNRQIVLKLVHETWINGMLEGSLYHSTLLTLGLREQPGAVANPWRLVMQETERAERALPAGTGIAQVYDEADGTLLILGEPGAGKTTLLLQLASDLLTRAGDDVQHPLPVVFPLSTWAEQRLELDAWLVAELHRNYLVPVNIGKSWIESDQLLPLLDGLDEVEAGQRSACIAAINRYRAQHPLTPLVVCSRRTDYFAQSARLALRTSVTVQPLSAHQIDEYLSTAGTQLTSLRRALQNDEDLRELAESPLMLNILMLTYEDVPESELETSGTLEQRRHRIFEQYVARMFKRGKVETRYSFEQTIHWLSDLAKQMKLHGQTQFYIERLQMDWLSGRTLQLYYRAGVLIVCLLVGGLIGWFLGHLFNDLLGELIGSIGLALSLGVWGVQSREIRPVNAFVWSWNVMRQRWLNIPLLMLVGGIAAGGGPNIKTSLLLNVLLGILLGGLTALVLNVFLSGPSETMPDTRYILTPNQEILISVVYSMVSISAAIVFSVLFTVLGNTPAIVMVGGFGAFSVIGVGGKACIQHLILRLLLWRSRQLPWNLPRFLQFGSERILLRRVGGGYVFIHRLLLDYFAGLSE